MWKRIQQFIFKVSNQLQNDEAEEEIVTENSGTRWLIVGLGNPGKKYRANRHNIGFMAINKLAHSANISTSKVQQKSIVGTGKIGSTQVILAKPQTFMNNSGDSVGPLARYFKIDPANVLVIYDELDISFGNVRIRPKGGAGGHNGMKSIINHLGNDFPRIRLGIGRPPGRMPAAAYVLQNFNERDDVIVDEMLATTVDIVNEMLANSVDNAMNKFNKSADS